MKTNKLIIFVLMFFINSFTSRSEFRNSNEDKVIVGEINRAYLNFHFPMKQPAARKLFYECSIFNNTNDSIHFELPFSYFYDEDRERRGNIRAIYNENDTVDLYCRNYTNRNLKLAPGQLRKIDFSLDASEAFFVHSKSDNYLLFIDSLAFVTKEILIYNNEDELMLKLDRGKDYVMEHRFLEYYTVGEGYKE